MGYVNLKASEKSQAAKIFYFKLHFVLDTLKSVKHNIQYEHTF